MAELIKFFQEWCAFFVAQAIIIKQFFEFPQLRINYIENICKIWFLYLLFVLLHPWLNILALLLLRVLNFHIAHLFLFELFNFSSHRCLFKLHSLTDLPIAKCSHIGMNLPKKLNVILSFYNVFDGEIVDFFFLVFKCALCCL